MRIAEIEGGMRIQISEEESTIVEKIKSNGKIYKRSLQERDAEVARRLVTTGVINRGRDKKGTYYYYRNLENVSRTQGDDNV